MQNVNVNKIKKIPSCTCFIALVWFGFAVKFQSTNFSHVRMEHITSNLFFSGAKSILLKDRYMY